VSFKEANRSVFFKRHKGTNKCSRSPPPGSKQGRNHYGRRSPVRNTQSCEKAQQKHTHTHTHTHPHPQSRDEDATEDKITHDGDRRNTNSANIPPNIQQTIPKQAGTTSPPPSSETATSCEKCRKQCTKPRGKRSSNSFSESLSSSLRSFIFPEVFDNKIPFFDPDDQTREASSSLPAFFASGDSRVDQGLLIGCLLMPTEMVGTVSSSLLSECFYSD